MLARKIKIRTLESQKAKLKEVLLELENTGRYVHNGHVYPENVKYFEEQGFEVKVSDNGEVVFTVRDDIILTEDELRQSKDEASCMIRLD